MDSTNSSIHPTLLLLADGRFPSGGHAHSGGFEAAAALEGITDVDSMEQFLIGRLNTLTVVAASFAAPACATSQRAQVRHGDSDALGDLDRELDARTAPPALRSASRRLGRQILRAGRAIWPHPHLDALASPKPGPHQPIAFGAVAAVAGLDPEAAALAVAHDAALGPATAAVRLLGLDPYAVHAALARLAPHMPDVAAQGARYAHTPPPELPALTAPLLDIAAEDHRNWEVRLFAS